MPKKLWVTKEGWLSCGARLQVQVYARERLTKLRQNVLAHDLYVRFAEFVSWRAGVRPALLSGYSLGFTLVNHGDGSFTFFAFGKDRENATVCKYRMSLPPSVLTPGDLRQPEIELAACVDMAINAVTREQLSLL